MKEHPFCQKMDMQTGIKQVSSFILLCLFLEFSSAQFAPVTNGIQHIQDIHFTDGNEFAASINQTVFFQIELANFDIPSYPPPYIPSLCKDGLCIGQGSKINTSENYPTFIINGKILVESDNFYGTWGLHIAEHISEADSTPLLGYIYINNQTDGGGDDKNAILWCHDSETYNYVKLDGPPECPSPNTKVAPTELGSLTIYVDNYKVQSRRAWTCKVVVNTVKVKCVHLQQTPEARRESTETISVEECQEWYRNKSCKYGQMTSFADQGSLSWKTNNILKVKYNSWARVCMKGKPKYFTSHNCLMEEVPITYQAPFTELFSAATGTLPLTALATNGSVRAFKTIAWSAESSDAFQHVCRKVISLTVRVSKTTYSNLRAASQHKEQVGEYTLTNNTVYQFMAIDKNAVMYIAQEKDRTSLKAIDAGSCGDEYPDTFTSNSLVLQYVSDSYLALAGKARYTGVNHHPTLLGFHQDPKYAKVQEHTHLERTSDASDIMICGAFNLKSDTHECQNGTAVSKRKKRQVNPEVPDIIQARLDYLEAKQIQSSEEWVKQLGHQSCLQQRRIHYLQTMQLDIDPSDTFSSYTKRRVHVIPKGDIYALQHCFRLDCTALHVIPSLKTTYAPMKKIYEEKGVLISEQMAFHRPIIQFNHTGHKVTAQLQTMHYANPFLTFVTRCEKKEHRESKENAVLDVKFFEICGNYYIFEDNLHVSTMQVGEAGTEQHLIREFKKGHFHYSEGYAGEDNNNTNPNPNPNPNQTVYSRISMLIKSFASFAPAHLTVPDAAFYGLRKASYYDQEAIMSQFHSLRDTMAAIIRLQDTALYSHAQFGREEIHSTVNTMGDVLGALRDVSIGAGKAVGGFIGSAVGSAGGMAIKSFTDMATEGISGFLDSVFSKIVVIIGTIGGYLALVWTFIYICIAWYKKNWNIFVQTPGQQECITDE